MREVQKAAAEERRAKGSLSNLKIGQAPDVASEIDKIVKALDPLKHSFSKDFQGGKTNVVMIGPTGSGKSLSINWLHGCLFKQLDSDIGVVK